MLFINYAKNNQVHTNFHAGGPYMDTALKILLFLLVNIIGFFSAGICVNLAQMSGALSVESLETFNPESYMRNILMLWIVCALPSFAYFFVEGRSRYLFLWAPLVIPFSYGFSIIGMLLLPQP